MQDNRLYTRVNCSRTCKLYWYGSAYSATVKNMSIIAMGLHFDGSHPNVKIGDICLVYLDDNKKTYPYQVIRIDSSDIAVGPINVLTH